MAIRQLRAGRPGSWEAHLLTEMALWAGHGKPSRIHEDAAVTMQVVLHRWVTDPDRCTEVAIAGIGIRGYCAKNARIAGSNASTTDPRDARS